MRFFNLVAILALVGVSAEVSDVEANVSDVEVARNLRGSEDRDLIEEDRDLTEEDRDLLSIGVIGGSASYSKSSSFGFHKCWKADACVDAYVHCMSYAHTNTATWASGNSYAEAEFLAATICKALAEAHSRSCACVWARGDIDLDAKSSTYGMAYELQIKLKTATMTFAKASSAAGALAIAAGEGQVYATTDEAYCAGPGKDKYKCDPSKAKAYATVSALALGGAEAMADSEAAAGTNSYMAGRLSAGGQSVSSIGARFITVAKSWSFSQAETEAVAIAYTEVCGDAVAIAKQCDAAYDEHCSSGGCSGFKDKNEACDKAVAVAQGYGSEWAVACAGSVAKAMAATKIVVSYGGTLKNCLNNGQPLTLALDGESSFAEASSAAVCPRDY
jgi:hypothetical protein